MRVISDDRAAKETEVYGSRTQAQVHRYWSPDSRQVGFLANARRDMGLWLASVDGRAEARLLASGQPFYWDWAADSPQLLVHTYTPGDDARLGFVDTNGDALGDAIAEPRLCQAPGLSSDGRYLACADAPNRVVPMAEAGGRETVCVVPTDDRTRLRIADGSVAFWSR